MDDRDLQLFYPKFALSPEGRITPYVPVPTNFEKLVPIFYEQKRDKNIEHLATELGRIRERDIRLNWDERQGLINISVGTQGGLDLSDIETGLPIFQEHNLDGEQSLIAATIAQQYVFELLGCRI